MRFAVILPLAAGAAFCQVPNPTQGAPAPIPAGQSAPVFRVTVVSRTTQAVNYHHRSGTTRIDFRGTELLPEARGEAKVESRMGSTKIDTRFDKLTPATQFGPEYLTYVLWAITPEGRAENLGEVVLDGNRSKLLAGTHLQAFGLIVTAEPYFAVTQPSDVVVMENIIRRDTTGTIQPVDAKYHLLQRGSYVLDRSSYRPVRIDPKGPLQLAQARNAVEIARLAGAERYAADTFQKALVGLQNAEGYAKGKSGNRKPQETVAREAIQMAEDARIITIRKLREEEMANQRAAAERARERAAAEAAAAQKAEAERAAAEAARAQAAADRAAAEQQRRQAQAEADRAQQFAQQAQQAQTQAEAERDQLRDRLRQQLNAVLETRETARGLIVNISDVLFDLNRYTLKPGAREKLAKVSGILLAYPDLKLQLEGHTDATGSDAYNLRLSEQRAGAVLDYLVEQGVPAANVSATGLGEANPIAGNDTAAGRQQNRRVELIVTGASIGR